MLKLSNVFLKVGIIMCTIMIAVFALCSLGFFICIPFAGAIAANAAESGSSGSEGTALEAWMIITYAAFFAVFMLSFIPLYGVMIHLSLKGRREPNRGIYIANIVVGAICGSEFNVAAGIVGLCRLGKEQREGQIA